MFDISWTEFLLIGIVALIVIGPKELPAVMRTVGQWTRKIRNMAADFQRQFEREMREAELADLKKQVDDVEQSVKSYDPLKGVRSDVDAIGKDLEASLEQKTAEARNAGVSPAVTAAPASTEAPAAAPPEPAPQPAELSSPEPLREKQIVAAAAAAIGPVSPPAVEEAQPAPPGDSTRPAA
jgi:sec-independent protein translocase protein TatB